MRRLGPPQRLDGFLLIGAQIRFTEQTYAALVPAESAAQPIRIETTWQLPTPAAPVLTVVHGEAAASALAA